MKPGNLLSPFAVLMWSPGSPAYVQLCQPFPPSLCLPYRKDLLSDGHHVQAAVEILNPLAQFFFPGSDKGKEIICGHVLMGAQREEVSGTRQNHHKCRDKQLLMKDNSWFFKLPLIENGPGGGGGGWHRLSLLVRCPEVADPSWMGSSVPGLIGSAIGYSVWPRFLLYKTGIRNVPLYFH